MPAESRKYLINIKKLGHKFETPKDCVNTLYDEYRLEAKLSSGRVRITVYNDNQYDKLKRFLRKYKASKEYIEEVMGSEDYKLKKTKAIKEEMTKNNIYNNMNTRKRPSLNEAYFDQTRNGVLSTSMEDVYDMIPSRIQNGKKIIIFLHNDLVSEFKNMFANYRYNFGFASFEQIAEYGIDKLLMDNLQKSTFDVFVISFVNEDVINGFELDPQLSRRYATFAIDTPEVLHPSEIRRANEIDFNDDTDEQIQESLSYRRRASLNEAKASLNSRPSLNESWLDEEDEEDFDEESIENEEPVDVENDDPNMAFVDELVDKYDIEDQPAVEDFEDMILEIKEYVDDLDPDKFDGKLFCDMVGYLCRDKFGVFISEDPEFESIKYLFRGSLQESIDIRNSRRTALNEAKKEGEKPAKSEFAGKSIDGKKLRDYKLLELGDLLKEKREALKEAKAVVRKEKDEKKAVKLQKNVEKLQAEIEMIQNEIKFRKKNKMNESSVREQFNKYAKIFEEAEDISEEDDDKAEEPKDDDSKPADEEPKDDNKEEKEGDEEGDEEVPMTAVLVKVAKSDVEKAKKQMIDAGVEEDDIDEVEGDEDSDEVEIKVDANSIMALKD